MKALTLHQPWASLVAIGAKTVETRSWSTSYRGPLAIHAARVMAGRREGIWLVAHPHGLRPPFGRGGAFFCDGNPGPLGAVVATCTLADVVPTENLDGIEFIDPWAIPEQVIYTEVDAPEDCETTWCVSDQRPLGDFSPGRFAWLLADIEPLAEPVPARGRQQLWEWAA